MQRELDKNKCHIEQKNQDRRDLKLILGNCHSWSLADSDKVVEGLKTKV